MGISVGKENLVVGEENIPMGVGAGFNTSMYRSQSWFIRIARILFILYSKAH